MKSGLFTLAVIASSAAAVSVGDWNGTVKTDPMTDDQTIVLETYNAGDLAGALFLGTDIPVFTVLFTDGSNVPIIALQYTSYIGISGRTSTCMIRVDENPAVEYPTIIGNDSESFLIAIGTDNQTRDFFASLLRGNQVMIRFQPAGHSQVTSTFSLSGITGVSSSMGIDVDQYLQTADPESTSTRQQEALEGLHDAYPGVWTSQ